MVVLKQGKAARRCAASNALRTLSSSAPNRRANKYLLLQRNAISVSTLRYLSSSTNNRHKRRNTTAFTNTYGIPFSISPDTALETFRDWAHNAQGLSSNQWIFNNVAITAAYVPVWNFDLNVRYRKGNSIVSPPPLLAQAYNMNNKSSSSNIVYLPGMAAYAGYSYRRSLVDPVHSTSLLFLLNSNQQSSKALQPFHAYMLRDMKFNNNTTKLSVFPDPWNAPKGRALEIVRESLLGLAMDDNEDLSVQTQVVQSKRVYMPTYVIQYRVLGMEYQAFLSGCDEGATVSGVSHTLFDTNHNAEDVTTQASNLFTTLSTTSQRILQTIGGRNAATLVALAVQFTASIAARLVSRIPVIAAVGGAFVGFRKLIRPWMDQRTATAAWERQRDHERNLHHTASTTTTEDFVDTRGQAQAYFRANRDRILHELGGQQGRRGHQAGQGSYDWYAAWEQWARQQWEQQQRQQEQHSYGQQQQQQQQQQSYGQQQQYSQRTSRKRTSAQQQDFQWDFNPNDPYSVLGIQRGASPKQVSDAFRKQMLLHHPDTKANASDAERTRAEERSKLITNAYQAIKSEMRRGR